MGEALSSHFGLQVPLLTYEGEQLCQSIAIARFLANQYGLSGRTSLEKAQVCM